MRLRSMEGFALNQAIDLFAHRVGFNFHHPDPDTNTVTSWLHTVSWKELSLCNAHFFGPHSIILLARLHPAKTTPWCVAWRDMRSQEPAPEGRGFGTWDLGASRHVMRGYKTNDKSSLFVCS